MPEYLAPGVYVEEVSFRQKSIEGVSTSTAGFVGPTRFGPIRGEPELMTNFGEFERVYGGVEELRFRDSTPMVGYLAQAVRAFFEEGGQRLYVSRVFRRHAEPVPGRAPDGVGRLDFQDASPAGGIGFEARYPGAAGNLRVGLTARASENVLAGVPVNPVDLDSPREPVLRGVQPFDTVWIDKRSDAPVEGLYWAERFFDAATNRTSWQFHSADGGAPLPLTDLRPDHNDEVHIVTVTVEVAVPGRPDNGGRFARTETWDNLTFHPAHRRSLSNVFARDLANRTAALTVPLVFDDDDMNGPQIAAVLLGQERSDSEALRIAALIGLGVSPPPGPAEVTILATLLAPELSNADRTYIIELEGGNDGDRPGAAEFEGNGVEDPSESSGLRSFEHLADISIVATPGATAGYAEDWVPQIDQITRNLISHCQRMRYRIAVLDTPLGQSIAQVRAFRAQVDSSHAALYYPWIRVMDPASGVPILVPPSGSVAGIYARNDIERGVHKAPANEVVRQAIGLEVSLNKAHQDVLNPESVNCIRSFEGRGTRVWGARTLSSDVEWQYVNLRRYFAYLERSIEGGTQWAVFEPNGDELWGNVRQTIEDFLFNEWQNGRLLGPKPSSAYFVRCDRSTMSQNDLDTGRLVCLVGVAPLRPAEFVIFRIGQWTADRSN